MATPEEQYDAMFANAFNALSNRPLEYNPEITYGDVLSEDERTLGVYVDNDEVVEFARANKIYGENTDEYLDLRSNPDLEENPDFLNPFERARQYNIPPKDFNIPDRYPRYAEQLQRREEHGDIIMPVLSDRALRRYQLGYLDDPEELILGGRSLELSPPRNMAREQEIARWGIEPRDNEITFNDGSSVYNPTGDAAKFAWLVALSPRDMTLENYEHIGEKVGLEGHYRYINPNNPSLGVAFKREGEDEYQLMNTPGLSEQDIPTFIAQEAPALVGELTLQAAASRVPGVRVVVPTRTGFEGGIPIKAAKVTGLSAVLAAGAAGGDFARLALGNAFGAHDLDMVEAMEEAGITGLWSFGGTAAISTLSHALPSVWRTLTGKNVPPSYFERIDELFREAAEKESAVATGRIYGEGISIVDIHNQIDDLTNRFAEYFRSSRIRPGEGVEYKPTLGAQVPSFEAADLELLFLKAADDPKLKEMYHEIRLGNQEVIDTLTKVLSEKIGPSITGPIAEEITGATLRRGVNEIAQEQTNAIQRQMEEVIEGIRGTVGGADDAVEAGLGILAREENPEISNRIFRRVRSFLAGRVRAITDAGNEGWESALANDLYADTTTGAGFIRTPARDLAQARGEDVDKLFNLANTDEAVSQFYQLMGPNSRDILRRLQGIGETGFESPNFTIRELNTARADLNAFASNLDTDSAAHTLVRNLERGFEDQMYKLIRESAAETAQKARPDGKALTAGELDLWMKERGWGDDLRDAWIEQSEAYRLARSSTVQHLLQTERPEAVVAHLFHTTKRGTGVNTPVDQLMQVLKYDGESGDEILQLQNGVAAYIQREILNQPDKERLEIAREFYRFVNQHEGVLKPIFGDEYTDRFLQEGPAYFNRTVIAPLEELQGKIDLLRARFKLDPTASEGGLGDVINHVLSRVKDPNATRAGFLLEDVEYLADMVKNHPEVKDQMAVVTKRWIINEIIGTRGRPDLAFDTQALDSLLYGGFGPIETTGQRLSFESLIGPLLGDAGPEFIKNLRYLNNIAKREVGGAPSSKIADTAYPPGVRTTEFDRPGSEPLDGLRFLQRMLIAPLSIIGRRATAISNRAAENAHTFIGHMLLDEELFNKVIQAAKNRTNRQQIIRFLTAHQFATIRDMGNELKYYNTEDQILDLPEDYGTGWSRFLGDFPERYLELIEETGAGRI